MVQKEKEKTEFTEVFEKSLMESPDSREIFDIVKRNSQGRIWIIGGFVYRNIIKDIYGEIPTPQEIDIDFLIERSSKKRDLYVPEGWDIKITDYGNPYLLRGKTRIDLNYLFSFHSIDVRKLRPRFKYFFTGTPLDIQSIAYDLTDTSVGVTGWRGIDAIKRKSVRINNLEEAKFEASNRGISLEELVTQKAKELGFECDLTLPLPQIPKKTYGDVEKS